MVISGAAESVSPSFFAQAAHIDGKRIVLHKHAVHIPKGLNELVSRKRLAGMAHEEQKQAVFHGGQREFLAVAGNAGLCRIQTDRADGKTICTGGVASAQDRFDARQQLAEAKGLCDIIIGPQLQPHDGAALFFVYGQKNDGRGGRMRLDFLAQGKPVAIRQIDIQNGQLKRLPGKRVAGVFETSAQRDGISLLR